MNNYNWVICDLDGTLLNSDSLLREKILKFITLSKDKAGLAYAFYNKILT